MNDKKFMDANRGSQSFVEMLAERQKQHGSFSAHSDFAQRLKRVVREAESKLSDPQREALDMILHKIARICAGDPNHVDHWTDIAGYATRAREETEK